MKIAITAMGATPNDSVDERFGRAYWILFYDDEADSWDAFDNSEARNAMQGAGIRAAQAVADRGAEVVVTGATGPKAFQALSAAGIKIYHGAKGTTAAQALEAMQGDELEVASAPSSPGHV